MDLASGKIDWMAPRPQSRVSKETFRLEAVDREAAASSAPPAEGAAVTQAPMLVAQIARNSAPPVAAGEPWPTGTGENNLSNKFRKATPPEMRDLAPRGMALPLEEGFNVVQPTATGRHAAGDLGRLSYFGFGMLATNLLREYVSGKGVDQELSKKDTNKLLGSLMDSSKSMIDPARRFMDDNVDQINSAIHKHIADTGQTSGRLRGVTDWQTATDSTYRNSLGAFSGKLLYDVTYSKQEDGSIDVGGNVALAVQDLYDFGNDMLPITIPTWLLPREFTARPYHVDEKGYLTDVALANLQQEGFAKPFYVYGVSDTARLQMNLRPDFDHNWSVSQ